MLIFVYLFLALILNAFVAFMLTAMIDDSEQFGHFEKIFPCIFFWPITIPAAIIRYTRKNFLKKCKDLYTWTFKD